MRAAIQVLSLTPHMKEALYANKSSRRISRSLFEKWGREPSVSWWTPFWFRLDRVRRFRHEMLNPQSLSRIGLWSVVLGSVIVAGSKMVAPLLDFGFLWNFGYSLGGLYLLMIAICFIPTQVTVSRESITSPSGESGYILAKDIVAMRLMIFRSDRLRLTIHWRDELGTNHLSRVGLARKVKIDRLLEVSPVGVQIVDARERWKRPR